MRQFKTYTPILLISVSVMVVMIAACSPGANQTPTPGLPTPLSMADPVHRWDALQLEKPFAYTTPLFPVSAGPFDGVYTKVDQDPPQYWKCLRCADYRPVGGIWKLSFERGAMRIFYEVTGWYSVASYSTSADRLQIFNDPFCPYDVGEYKWKLDGESLILDPIEDKSCAFALRQENLGKQPWLSCDGSQGSQLPGCEKPIVPRSEIPGDLPVNVNVTGGDSRFFDHPPDVYAIANTADRKPPEGIQITYHEQAVGYGLHRILWWNGNWIETTTELPFKSMGVQIMGEAQIGWARVLFDDTEVWRGDTAAIWEKYGRHGGYIEISGYQPGTHTLRVESLGFDYRPVTVAGFGFDR